MKKNFIITIVCVFGLLLCQSAFSAAKFIDVNEAKAKISVYEADNKDFDAKAADMRTKIKTTQDENVEIKKKLDELVPLLDKVKVKSSAMFYYNQELADKTVKDQAQTAYNKNLDLRKKVEEKIDSLSLTYKANLQKIDEYVKNLGGFLYRVQKNNEEIIKINTKMANTGNQSEVISNAIKDIDKFVSDSEALLK